MMTTYLFICYIIGFFMGKNQYYNVTQRFAVIDLISFFLSPLVVPVMAIIKLCSNFWELDETLFSIDDENDEHLNDNEIKNIKDEIEKK